MTRRALIAMGGNSLVKAGERGTIEEQTTNVRLMAKNIVELVRNGWELVITHGNGPQVGAALLRSERSAGEVYSLPLDVCVASTQSEIGYVLQRSLCDELNKSGLQRSVVTVLTQVRVNKDDPAFQNFTKPVGPLYSKEMAEQKERTLGWQMVEDVARGFRRVVPSPEPVEILESKVIGMMMENGVIVIALGGGGIPVTSCNNHMMKGVEAVIDKDRASALLACELGLKTFIISTDVDNVFLDYRKPTQRPIGKASADEMQQFLSEGQFPPGSMGPKVQSAIRFLQNGGEEVIITSSELIIEAMHRHAGTHIVL